MSESNKEKIVKFVKTILTLNNIIAVEPIIMFLYFILGLLEGLFHWTDTNTYTNIIAIIFQILIAVFIVVGWIGKILIIRRKMKSSAYFVYLFCYIALIFIDFVFVVFIVWLITAGAGFQSVAATLWILVQGILITVTIKVLFDFHNTIKVYNDVKEWFVKKFINLEE